MSGHNYTYAGRGHVLTTCSVCIGIYLFCPYKLLAMASYQMIQYMHTYSCNLLQKFCEFCDLGCTVIDKIPWYKTFQLKCKNFPY